MLGCLGAAEAFRVPENDVNDVATMADGVREALEYDDDGSGLVLQLPALWFLSALTTVGSGNS